MLRSKLAPCPRPQVRLKRWCSRRATVYQMPYAGERVWNILDHECGVGVVDFHGLPAYGAADLAESSRRLGIGQASGELWLVWDLPILCPFCVGTQGDGIDHVAQFWWQVHEPEGLLRASVRVVVFSFMFWAAGAGVGERRLCMTRCCFGHVEVLLRKFDDSLMFAGRLL